MKILQIKSLSKRYSKKDAFALKDFNLEVEEGELLALIGESGSGKTTLLRLIAGFEEPLHGEIYINGELVVDQHTFKAPEKRKVGMVFQDYALFPHLSIYNNLCFGLNKWKSKDKKARVKEMLELVGLEDYEERYPHQLSGGQQQRIALARSLAPNPALILLDEPFSNLDTLLKEQVREDIKMIIKSSGTTAIFVTHDTKDALSTADRIAILKEGSIQQLGSPEEVYNHPINAYVANFFGKVNILQASSTPTGYNTPIGFIPMKSPKNVNRNIKIVIRPENIELASSFENSFTGNIKNITYLGEHKQLLVCVDNNQENQLLIKVKESLRLHVGDSIYCRINENKIQIIE
ncbi:MAG: ABC transporter ATP-binding protein [Bacteroidota bacterium]|nr:ABC transporter ATP-binding protein [Bacteroidota bacterium]